MGLKAAIQALKKAEPLKDKVQRCKDLLNDNDAWVCQQQLQKIYQQVLILDLEYALDKKVEQELWNLGFKNYIVTLQSQAKDRKNPKRGESQALLSWCLEAASGFYLTLLQEICTAFDLDLPFRRKGYVYGCTSPWKAVEKLSAPHKSSCFYACQYCLVHLGDIARYRNESKQAELFYRHAVSLSPSSGQPYNQLALLEASRGNKLGTVFHYARSVAVKHPFSVATTNLAKTLSSALNDNSFNIDGKTKLNSQEYVTVFLKLHGVIQILGDLKVAPSYVKLLTETLTALVATESFSSWMLVQMLVINLYTLQHTAGSTADSPDLLKIEQLTADEKVARDCILDLIAGSLSALLLPVYTIKNSIVDYFALPSIKLCLDWIHIKPTVLEETAFTSRLQIWPSLCVLLNALQNCVANFKYDQYAKVPLPEDRDLQGFLPLEKSFENLRFTNTDLEDDLVTLNKLRAVRILYLGHRLAQYQINGSALISHINEEGKESNKFISTSKTTGLSNELMKELEELSLSKEKQLTASGSPVLSESSSSKGSAEMDISESVERRVGILKPQGSLERSRDSTIGSSTEGSNSEINSLPTRKPRQNIAMQAIMRRAETEQKQVTFKNVSPVIIEESSDKKSQVTSESPSKNGISKSTPIGTELPKINGTSNADVLASVQNRLPSTLFIGNSVQNQSMVAQSQSKPAKLQLGTQPSQINQVGTKEQQISGTPVQTSGIGQFGQQVSSVKSMCYENNQSFSVQNPQFAKSFMTSRVGNVQGQIHGQVNNTPQNLVVRHALNQNRPLHQRSTQNISQNSLLQQNMGVPAVCVQQNVIQNVNVSQGARMQQPSGINVPQNMGMQQQNHNLNMQQQNVIQNEHRPNGISSHVQMSITNSAINISTVPPLSTYQKSSQQATSIASAPSVSLSPTNMSNFQVNFNQNVFNQNIFNNLPQKQLSPTMYNSVQKSSDVLEFPFTSQTSMNKSQQPPTSNYPMFRNYEASDFVLWKDSRPPQPPVAWWGTSSSGTQVHGKEAPVSNAFQNWSNPTTAPNMVGRIPITISNNYQQSAVHSRHFNIRNNFEDARTFEVDHKVTQSNNTGNTYSLFSGNSWGSNPVTSNTASQDQIKARLHQQSLWSGPGPSPLERLLEQQKSLREGGT